ncbi:LytTR family DNA-binding domain-containing protein [Chitinophaga sp. S165]|uniref:LytR/AlgR family response regulator transcription factor n=1 Tax=Chitinophaga sp. S165 TaxID=2135462 RepID=UPI000D709A85|nr:LytTR family DNA-binding domain-containing protein [Chitinophaga sp. S165]
MLFGVVNGDVTNGIIANVQGRDFRSGNLILHNISPSEMILEEKIVYAAVEKNYICIKLVDGRSLRIRKSLQQFLEELTPDHFIRVHKKYVVCINHVRFVDTEVTMVVGNPLPIGREYKDDFLSHFRIC